MMEAQPRWQSRKTLSSLLSSGIPKSSNLLLSLTINGDNQKTSREDLESTCKGSKWDGHLMTYTENQVKNPSQTFEVKQQHFYKKTLRENFTTVDCAMISQVRHQMQQQKEKIYKSDFFELRTLCSKRYY